jgi:hypothetical protein
MIFEVRLKGIKEFGTEEYFMGFADRSDSFNWA